MKKRNVILLAFCGFFLSLAFGYYLTKSEMEAQNLALEENAVSAVKKEITIKKEGQIVYQYYYQKDGITKEQVEPVPDFLEGIDREQLQSIYNGWQIVYFAPEKVILRCGIDGRSSEVYMLGENNGYLAVFYEDNDKKLRLKEQTEVPLSILPETEREQLAEGLYVLGEENLVRLLSDFSS